MGVSILPRFAASVSNTSVCTSAFSLPVICRNTSRVKGTRVISVTSFVKNILNPKQSSTSSSAMTRMEFTFRSRNSVSTRNVPAVRSPATTAIRENKRPSTRQSTYETYEREGGTRKHDTRASTADTTSTVCDRKN